MGWWDELEQEPTIEELNQLFPQLEQLAKENSDDAETQVAANIYSWVIDEFSTFNTFVNGAKGLPNTRPDKYKYIVHAEANLVNWAARRGFSLEDKIILCTLSPCQNCIRTLFQAGVRVVYYKDRYHAHNPNMEDIKVTEQEFGSYTKMVLGNYE